MKRFRKRRVEVRGIDDIWAADLVDMQSFAKYSDGVKHLLTVIDVYSKYGWIVPLKDKRGKSTADGFTKIISSSGRKPGKVRDDKGK